MPDAFILDPSMFLHKRTLALLSEFVCHGFPIFVPNSFLVAIDEMDHPEEILGFFVPEQDMVSVEEAVSFVRKNRKSFEGYRCKSEHGEFAKQLAMQIENPRIREIILEEWEFMNTHSLIFSRIRKAMDAMVNAGAAALTVSKKAAEKLIRKTLKLPDDASISTNETLRAACKWVALGGPSIWQIIEPVSGAALVVATGAAGVFLQYDP
jgi:hypothetical protein